MNCKSKQELNSLEYLESADKIREKQKIDRQIVRPREHLFGGAGILPAQDSQDGCPTNHISVVLELVSEDKSWQAILDGYPKLTRDDIHAAMQCTQGKALALQLSEHVPGGGNPKGSPYNKPEGQKGYSQG